jgi:hypothetical protein
MNFNVWAAIAAAASCFLLGGVWYSPAVFGRLWGCEAGMPLDGDPQGRKGGHPAKVFAVAIAFSLIAAFAFAWWLGPNPPLDLALKTGAVVGLGFVATSFGINYSFANRSTLMWAIDAGYHAVQFVLFGLILGLWS